MKRLNSSLTVTYSANIELILKSLHFKKASHYAPTLETFIKILMKQHEMGSNIKFNEHIF